MAFKPMRMIVEKIPTVAICEMGKPIDNLIREIIKTEEEYIKMEQLKALGLDEKMLNCNPALTLEELNKMFSEIDTENIDKFGVESISNIKKRIKYCKNPMERKQLEQKLNVLYKEQKRKRKNVKNK